MLVLVLRRRIRRSIDSKKIVDVRALAARVETRDDTRYEEATSTSLDLKKKETCKIKTPQIKNKCIGKAQIQLIGAVMEVGYLLKCLLMVLFFFGLAILVKI